MNHNIAPSTPSLSEEKERVYGANPTLDASIDLYTNRFTDTDTQNQRDTAPSAPYEQGFDALFPSKTLLMFEELSGRTFNGNEPVISSVAQAEFLASYLNDPTQRDYALSEIALYYLHHDNVQRAGALLHSITDDGRAAHVMAHILEAADRHEVELTSRDTSELKRELGHLAHNLAEAPSVNTAEYLEEAAEVLADASLLKNLHPLTPAATHEDIRPLPASDDGTQRADMAALLQD